MPFLLHVTFPHVTVLQERKNGKGWKRYCTVLWFAKIGTAPNTLPLYSLWATVVRIMIQNMHCGTLRFHVRHSITRHGIHPQQIRENGALMNHDCPVQAMRTYAESFFFQLFY